MTEATAPEKCSRPGSGSGHPPRRAWLLPIGLYLLLAGTGLSWGLPNAESWSNDDIAPSSVLRVDEWYRSGSYKYPYLQLLIDRVLYEPYLRLEAAAGHIQAACLPVRRCLEDPPRQLGQLILISRLRSLFMGLGLLLLTAAVAGAAFGPQAAFWAALLASVNETLGFYAKQGNLDVPYTFWFMASVWVYQRILRGAGPRHWLAFGTLAGAALATKEGIIGAYPLMGLAMLINAWRHEAEPAREAGAGAAAPAAARRLAWSLGLMAFGLLAVYALAMNAVFNPQGLTAHLRHWLQGEGVAPYNDDYQGALWFASEIGSAAVFGAGWPLFLGLVCGSAFSLADSATRRPAIALSLPLLSYFAFTIVPIRFIFPRFLLPVYLLLACLAAPQLARLGRVALGKGPRPRHTRLVAASLIALLFGYSACYSLNVGLAMRQDSRLQAEAWLAEHLEAGTQIVGLGSRGALPRLDTLALEAEWIDWRRLPPYLQAADLKDSERADDEFQALAQMLSAADRPSPVAPPGAPHWLLLSSRSMPSPAEAGHGLWQGLIAGRAGYRLRWDSGTDIPVRARYDDRPSPLGAWLPGLVVEARVSPRIWILERRR